VPGDFSIIHIPLGWREGFGTLGRERTLLQSYQRLHEKRDLAGQTARSPGYVLPYFAGAPVLGSIAALEEGRQPTAAAIAADRANAAALVDFLDLRYIVVHGDYIGGPVDQYLQSVLSLRAVAGGSGEMVNSFWHFGADGKWVETRPENAAWVLYEVAPAPHHEVTSIEMADPLAQSLYMPAGWSPAEEISSTPAAWAGARDAEVLMRLDAPRDSTLVMRAAPFSYAGLPPQRVTVSANGHKLGTLDMQDGWQEYRLPVPASALKTGINQIWLEFEHVASPAQVLGSSDQRSLAAAVESIRLQ
jgi:hypothetical protein